MAIEWYYGRGADITGPVSDQDLADLVTAGRIIPTDTVWKEGTEMGVPAGRVKGLFPTSPHSPVAPDVEAFPVVEDVSPVLSSAETLSETVQPEGLVLPNPDAELVPLEESPAMPAEPAPAALPVRKARATAGRGAVIVGQDGTNVKFRMKCTTCGHEDSSWKTMKITRGTTRSTFFCQKCRKRRDSEIHGVM